MVQGNLAFMTDFELLSTICQQKLNYGLNVISGTSSFVSNLLVKFKLHFMSTKPLRHEKKRWRRVAIAESSNSLLSHTICF